VPPIVGHKGTRGMMQLKETGASGSHAAAAGGFDMRTCKVGRSLMDGLGIRIDVLEPADAKGRALPGRRTRGS